VHIGTDGTGPPITGASARAAIRIVLAGERAGRAVISVTYLSGQRMRALNRRAFGRDRATDVIAFGMRHNRQTVGDIYVCPSVAAASARAHGIAAREEVIRLVIHGTLHALGHDHPAGAARVRSPMWRRQERYVRRWMGGPAQ
jgi:probable rRNA maturation factor